MIPIKAIVLQRRFHVCHAGYHSTNDLKGKKGLKSGLEAFDRAFDLQPLFDVVVVVFGISTTARDKNQ